MWEQSLSELLWAADALAAPWRGGQVAEPPVARDEEPTEERDVEQEAEAQRRFRCITRLVRAGMAMRYVAVAVVALAAIVV